MLLPVEEQTESLTVVDREVKLIPDVRNPEDRLQETLNESSLNVSAPEFVPKDLVVETILSFTAANLYLREEAIREDL